MSVLEIFNLSLVFTVNILTISVVGVLVAHLVENYTNKRYLVYFSVIYTVFFIRNIIFVYRFYLGNTDIFPSYALPILTLAVVLPTLFIVYKLKGLMHKAQSIGLATMSVALVVSCMLLTIIGTYFFVTLHLVSLSIFTLAINFYLVEFLILMRSPEAIYIKSTFSKLGYLTKNRGLLLFVLSSMLLALVAIKVCVASNNELPDSLTVYNWEEYFDPQVINDFENEYGVKIDVKTFEDENMMLDDLRGGVNDYDVVIVSNALISDMIRENLLQPIRKKNVPNLKYIDKKCLDDTSNISGKIYGAGYMHGTTGLAYNIKYVDDADSWGALWNPKYSGRITLLNNEQEVVAIMSKFISGNIVPQSKHDLEHIGEFLYKEMKHIYALTEPTDTVDALVNERVWLAQLYSGDALLAMEQNENIAFSLPKEGGAIWTDNLAILSNSDKRHTAEVFINYMLRPEVGAKNSNFTWFASCNSEAINYIDEEVVNAVPLYSGKELLNNYESISKYGTLSDELKFAIDALWSSLSR